jgi:hypothetical protein
MTRGAGEAVRTRKRFAQLWAADVTTIISFEQGVSDSLSDSPKALIAKK